MDLMNVPAKLEVCTFTRSWDNSEYLKTLCSPWIRRSRSSIFVLIESAYMTSYESVIVTLVLSCTVSEISQVVCAPEWPFTALAARTDAYKYFFQEQCVILELLRLTVSVQAYSTTSSWHFLLLTLCTPAVTGWALCWVSTEIPKYEAVVADRPPTLCRLKSTIVTVQKRGPTLRSRKLQTSKHWTLNTEHWVYYTLALFCS